MVKMLYNSGKATNLSLLVVKNSIEGEIQMLKFVRSFEGSQIRMVKDDDNNVLYSMNDVAIALGLSDVRRVVASAVVNDIVGKLQLIMWDGQGALFGNVGQSQSIALKAEWELSKRFLSWSNETENVADSFEILESVYKDESEKKDNKSHFATTQIAKKYGLSARELNEILRKNGIQYKVNDQWVLYTKFHSLNLVTTVKINKSRSDGEEIFHTYWTNEGVKFIENILDKLGYKQHGVQLNLFHQG